MTKRNERLNELREACESDLYVFACTLEPHRVWGDVHKELFRWWQSHIDEEDGLDNLLCLLPRDHQKALRLDQRVLTPDGWKATGDLAVGDSVYGADGLPQKVVELHPISEMDIYEVEFADGRKVYCNDEHLWTLVCPSNTGDKLVTKPLKDILLNYKACRTDKRNGKEYTEWRYFLEPSLPVELPSAQLPVDPYVLGCWLGDGDSATGVITAVDEQLLDNLERSWHALECKKYAYRIEGLTSDLRKLGVLNNKHIPAVYMFGDVHQRLSLLQGLMDTDGYARQDGKYQSFSSSVKELAEQVQELVWSLGGRCTMHESWNSYTGSSKRFQSWTLNIWMPDGVIPFRLTRKAERMRTGQKLRVALKNIKKVDRAKARCITVSNPDGLFITENYVVTHNSHCMSVLAAWLIARDPATTILYVSATATLAERQLFDIKQILTCETFAVLWPDMIHPDEGKRTRWNNNEIIVDHPARKKEGVRDSTIYATGLSGNFTGLHCKVLMKDDVVVPDNAYTEEARRKVAAACSQLSSVLTTGGKEFVVGTRYHPSDHYNDVKEMKEDIYDDQGEIVGERTVYDIFERVVEKNGVFLWPKEFRADGKPFGFDWKELARKKAKYLDKTQFFAQYYNNPNDLENQRIDRSAFQYYDRKKLENRGGIWYMNNRRLNVYSGIDFAFSMSKKADFTCIVVIGVDYDFNIYLLDIERFKTNKMETYFENVLSMHSKWEFSTLRAEVTVAQETIVEYLKDRAKREGMVLKIDSHRPNKYQGAKEERIAAALEPRYQNGQIFHFKGGYCTMLEEELMLENPPHDDLKDTLAIVVSGDIKKPSKRRGQQEETGITHISYHPRFGGVI